MISTLLMFGVVFKGRILTSHSISANIDIGMVYLLWVPFLRELIQASRVHSLLTPKKMLKFVGCHHIQWFYHVINISTAGHVLQRVL